MSRYIDPDSPLSPEDRAYLEERMQFRTIRLHDAVHGTKPDEFTGTVPTTPPPRPDGPSGSGSVVTEGERPVEPTNDPEDVEFVDSLDMDELRTELKKAGEPTNGKKVELQQRLLKVLAQQD